MYLWCALLFSGTFTSFAQERVVSGKIVAEDGTELAGVNVTVKGAGRGVISDAGGNYKISVADHTSILVFSFIGFDSQEVTVGNRTIIPVSMVTSAESLNEVVVTALGIKREERSLGYSVGKVDGRDLSRITNENVLNGLAGRVPGVAISSTGTTGSSVSMIIRGATSLSNDNQPLFVIDGVPISNTLNNVSQVGSDNRVDYGNAISDLNPDNIESVSILKGPSAAALYGSRAGNGVVLITTKTGAGVNKMTVQLTTNTVFDNPYRYLDVHSKFATGVLPFTPDNNPYPGGIMVIDEPSAGAVGPELNKGYKAIQWNSPRDENGNPIPTELISYPDNVKNFVQTGITTTNGLAISNQKDNLTYRIGYTNMSNRGIIPNSDLFRNNLELSSMLRLSPRFSISTNLNMSRNNSNNRPAGERGTNPLEWAYKLSPHTDIRELENYWVPGQEGLQQLSPAPADRNNPYFLAYEVLNSFSRDRFYGNLKADWQITKEFSLMGRYGMDTYGEVRETKIGNSYTGDPNGSYGLTNLKRYERNADFLATFAKDLPDFSFSVSGGGNARLNRTFDAINKTRDKTGLIIPGLFTLANIAPEDLQASSYHSKKVVYSVYGLANIGYKDMAYLDLTARNDWSSTLPEINRSYFYPSASLSLLLNHMLLKSARNVDLLKLRGGVAQVGNDTNPYSLTNVLVNWEAWGSAIRLGKSGNLLLPDLKPEIATSYEAGIDLAMFRNRLRSSFTWYMVENRNQIIPTTLPSSSGFSSNNINAGLLESKGIEFTLGGTVLENKDWRIDLDANIARNRTIIKELTDDLDLYQLWSEGRGGAWTYVGEEIGDLYDRKLVVVEDKNSPYYGWPLLDESGSWQAINQSSARNKIGNFNPDFTLGLRTAIRYKRVNVNMFFDWRQGGEFVSQTYRYFESDLKTQRFLDNLIHPGGRSGDELRDYLVANANELIIVNGNKFNIVGGPTAEYGGFPFEYGGKVYPYAVFNPGVIGIYDDAGNIIGYKENLGNEGTQYIPYGDNYPWDFNRAATFDASFIKLREISVGYDLPGNWISRLGLQNVNFSVYSRNIMLWNAAKVGIDPEMAFQPSSGAQAGTQFKQGIERFNVTPWVIPVGFKLGVTF